MALPGASAMPGLYANPAPGNGLGDFIDFLNGRKKKPQPGDKQDPMMGSSINAASYGGNLVSPAMQAMLAPH
jgi:hypothetical protein